LSTGADGLLLMLALALALALVQIGSWRTNKNVSLDHVLSNVVIMLKFAPAIHCGAFHFRL